MSTDPDKSQPALSIITALYNRVDLTRAYLDTLRSTLPPSLNYEIILVDDLSTDGTRDFLNTLSAPCRVFLNTQKGSYAINNNFGVSQARAPILALLNNDLEMLPGWLEPMLELLQNQPNCGAVGNIQLNARTGLLDHAGVAFNHEGVPFHSYKNRKSLPPGNFCEKNAISAACLLIKRETFTQIGGFDERYVNGSEDIDLCIRLRLAGYRLFVSHRSVVRHHVSSSPGRMAHVSTNSQLLMSTWSSVTREWGQKEWPREYLNRYKRHFWKMRPLLALKALLAIAHH